MKSAYSFRPRWWTLLLAAPGCVAGVLLGNWQSGRAEQKRAAAAHERRLELRGEFLERYTVLLDNKVNRGRAGYHVVQPLRAADGRHVLVNRGWVAAPSHRENLPKLLTPAGTHVVEGRVLYRFPRAYEPVTAKPEGRVWQNVEVTALEPKADGTCPSCGGARRGGLTQWEVATIAPFERRALPPPELRRGGGVEPGTNRPTVVDPGLAAARRQFDARHPDHRWDAFATKVVVTFIALQRAWSEGRWEPARPLETDALFQTHRFWMERYASFGRRNRVESVAVRRVDLARIVLDAFYEAVTVRIYASALDWTEDAGGKVVGGSRDEPRTFSEYWTFLRAVGARRREDAGPASCPKGYRKWNNTPIPVPGFLEPPVARRSQ